MSKTLDELAALADEIVVSAARENFMPGGYASAREALRTRLAAIVEDAERYQAIKSWDGAVRDGSHAPQIRLYGLQGVAEDAFLLAADLGLDAAIDAARNQTKEPQ